MQTNDSPHSDHAEQDDHPNLTESTPLIGENLQPSQTRESTTARVQFLTLCLSTFILGWTSSWFPLAFFNLMHYGVDTMKGMRIIGLSQSIGIVAGGLINMPLAPTLGFGKMLLAGSVAQTTACTLQTVLPTWPLFVLSYFFQGFGIVLLNTHARAFIAVKRRNDVKMGILFIIYEVGNMASLSFMSVDPHSESLRKYYPWFSLFLSFLSVVALAVVFQLQELDACLTEGGENLCNSEPDILSHSDGFTQLIKMKATHILGAFYTVYIATRGITTLSILRSESHNVGIFLYILSGGNILGYIILIPVNRKLGEVNAAYYYILSATALLLIAWLVQVVAVKVIAFGTIGLIYGALSPIITTYTGRTFPRYLVPGAIGWLAACSTLVSHAVPPLTEIIFSRYASSGLLLCAFTGLLAMSLGLYRLRQSPPL